MAGMSKMALSENVRVFRGFSRVSYLLASFFRFSWLIFLIDYSKSTFGFLDHLNIKLPYKNFAQNHLFLSNFQSLASNRCNFWFDLVIFVLIIQKILLGFLEHLNIWNIKFVLKMGKKVDFERWLSMENEEKNLITLKATQKTVFKFENSRSVDSKLLNRR
jgi:hypothetical protein